METDQQLGQAPAASHGRRSIHSSLPAGRPRASRARLRHRAHGVREFRDRGSVLVARHSVGDGRVGAAGRSPCTPRARHPSRWQTTRSPRASSAIHEHPNTTPDASIAHGQVQGAIDVRVAGAGARRRAASSPTAARQAQPRPQQGRRRPAPNSWRRPATSSTPHRTPGTSPDPARADRPPAAGSAMEPSRHDAELQPRQPGGGDALSVVRHQPARSATPRVGGHRRLQSLLNMATPSSAGSSGSSRTPSVRSPRRSRLRRRWRRTR